jgi:hypothetical protein
VLANHESLPSSLVYNRAVVLVLLGWVGGSVVMVMAVWVMSGDNMIHKSSPSPHTNAPLLVRVSNETSAPLLNRRL